MTAPIRILVVDDYSAMHRSLSEIIEVFDDLEVIGHANNGEEAVEMANRTTPDIILMDVIMPKMDGIEATRQIHEQHPDIKILALSSFQDKPAVKDMLNAGAVGYVLKSSSLDDITHTIRAAHSGKSIFSGEITDILMQPDPITTPQSQPDYGLTPREIDVLRLLVQGHNNSQIACELVISLSTAKFHVSKILSKLNASSRVEAVALAVEHQLVS